MATNAAVFFLTTKSCCVSEGVDESSVVNSSVLVNSPNLVPETHDRYPWCRLALTSQRESFIFSKGNLKCFRIVGITCEHESATNPWQNSLRTINVTSKTRSWSYDRTHHHMQTITFGSPRKIETCLTSVWQDHRYLDREQQLECFACLMVIRSPSFQQRSDTG